MSIVYQPSVRHYCGPNRYGYWLEAWSDAPGTVRECPCGKSWVAYRDEHDIGYLGVRWRREGRWARRHRMRRQAVTHG